MKQKFIILAALLGPLSLFAQNGWLPPVTFPNNTAMCDDASWKLVLYDDFNGSCKLLVKHNGSGNIFKAINFSFKNICICHTYYLP